MDRLWHCRPPVTIKAKGQPITFVRARIFVICSPLDDRLLSDVFLRSCRAQALGSCIGGKRIAQTLAERRRSLIRLATPLDVQERHNAKFDMRDARHSTLPRAIGGRLSARRKARGSDPVPEGRLRLYGLHTVAAALANPQRARHRLFATENALRRLEALGVIVDVPVDRATPRQIDALLGCEAVHQGLALEVEPLPPLAPDVLRDARLVLVLDRISDPHNVGAILRSASALGADAVIAATRHAPAESAVMAKSASGALDSIVYGRTVNLAAFLRDLRAHGFYCVALDSDGAVDFETCPSTERLAIVLGAEGKGVRPGIRAACDACARLVMPGAIRSLNVSNAAALALYIARRRLEATA